MTDRASGDITSVLLQDDDEPKSLIGLSAEDEAFFRQASETDWLTRTPVDLPGVPKPPQDPPDDVA